MKSFSKVEVVVDRIWFLAVLWTDTKTQVELHALQVRKEQEWLHLGVRWFI